jgi:hypothetical protein
MRTFLSSPSPGDSARGRFTTTVSGRGESTGEALRGQFRFSEVLSALSGVLDLVEGQPEGHAVRSCLIGMRVTDRLGLDAETRSALFYALLLKDAGCSSNASKMSALFDADDI